MLEHSRGSSAERRVVVTHQHGGGITVDSKAGEYSEFTIRLPRND